jgi:hypothetical protein
MHHGSSDQFLSYLIEAPSVAGSVIWEKEDESRVVRRRATERSEEPMLGSCTMERDKMAKTRQDRE